MNPYFAALRRTLCANFVRKTQKRRISSPCPPTKIQFEHSMVMSYKLPALKEKFQSMADENGSFPLLSAKQRHFITNNPVVPVRSKQAAVLVILCSVNESPCLVFTKRSRHLSNHAAEISFPGGHFEREKDRDLVETAMRESEEELFRGQPNRFLREGSEILGTACSIPSLNGTPVTPVLAVLPFDLKHPVTDTFPGNPDEVDVVFTVSLRDLLKHETRHHLPSNRFGVTLAPVFPSSYGNIWGLTALILRPLLHKLLKPVFQEQ